MVSLETYLNLFKKEIALQTYWMHFRFFSNSVIFCPKTNYNVNSLSVMVSIFDIDSITRGFERQLYILRVSPLIIITYFSDHTVISYA